MTFDRYLAEINDAVRAGGNFHSVLFDELPDLSPPPTREQLTMFLAKLTPALRLETRAKGGAKDAAQVDQRVKAIDQIAGFVDNASSPTAFTNIDKHVFAFQLALRVRSPRIIDQDKTTLCGPVAIVYDVVKRDPERYVQFAISLFSLGSGQFGTSQVTPSATIRNGYRTDLLPAADYVVLASVRDTDAIVMSSDLLRNIFTLAKPGALCEFLRRAGYRDVQDHTFLTLSAPLRILSAVTPFGLNDPNHNPFDKGNQNLLEAEREINIHKRFIVMNAEGALSNTLVNRTSSSLAVRPDPLPADETHWTAIRKLSITANKVRIKIITWGGSYEGEIPKDALLSRYAGYVSASP